MFCLVRIPLALSDPSSAQSAKCHHLETAQLKAMEPVFTTCETHIILEDRGAVFIHSHLFDILEQNILEEYNILECFPLCC